MEEPCVKKPRNEFPFHIKAILSDDLCKAIPLEVVLVSRIDNKKAISSIIAELSRSLPLPSLQHLKRVRQNEIILCKDIGDNSKRANKSLSGNDIIQIKEYIASKGISTDVATLLCQHVSLLEVPSRPTKLRWQYEDMNRLWPCKFHPNRYMESLFNGTNFPENEKQFHFRIASIVSRLSDIENTTFGICVDPRTNSIVAIATGRASQNPVMHCPMVLIDFVARSQNKGAWQYDDEQFTEFRDEKLNFRGIPQRFYDIIVNTLHEDFRFGAENIISKEERREEDLLALNNLVKYGPYLCTGYDVYLTVEPCLMCAMALVHSRVRRIFYLESFENGALQSRMKLHTVKELNHHFEVFKICSERKNIFNKCQ